MLARSEKGRILDNMNATNDNARKIVKATSLNVWALAEIVAQHGDNLAGRIFDATSVPHVKRCIAAGLLAQGAERGTWTLTEAGRAAIASAK